MKNKKNKLFTYFLMVIKVLLFILMLTVFLIGCNKPTKVETVQFKCNYFNDLVKFYINEDVLSMENIEDTYLLITDKNAKEYAYVNIMSLKAKEYNNDYVKLLEDYKDTFSTQFKVTDISETSVEGMAFSTYSLIDKNSNVITVYSKAISNGEDIVMAVYFCSYLNDNNIGIELKNTFDSLSFNQ